MQTKQFITALALGVSAVVATSHGEALEHKGLEMRYQQLGKGVFVAVPRSEWDDKGMF